MASQLYTVPVIASGLCRTEFIKQSANTCDYLDSVFQDVFDRIVIRLNVYRALLNQFDERIQHSKAHIDRIKGSKRALQVHSSAQYPVKKTRSTYKSIFESNTGNQSLALQFDESIPSIENTLQNNDETLVVLKQYENNFMQKTKTNTLLGVSKPSANIKSVVSFLKYNTHENPYMQPTKIDPLSVSSRPRKPTLKHTEPLIPHFYIQPYERSIAADMSYKPENVYAHEFVLPDDLPGLDNCATSNWTLEQAAPIAPSFAISMLPDIDDIPPTVTTTTAVTQIAESIEPPHSSLVFVSPPIDTSVTIVPRSPSPAVTVFSVEPQSVLSPSPIQNESQTSNNNQVALKDFSDRSLLLDDIINFANKKRLRSTTKQSPLVVGEEITSMNVEKSSTTGNAFTDDILARARKAAEELCKNHFDESSSPDIEWED